MVTAITAEISKTSIVIRDGAGHEVAHRDVDLDEAGYSHNINRDYADMILEDEYGYWSGNWFWNPRRQSFKTVLIRAVKGARQ